MLAFSISDKKVTFSLLLRSSRCILHFFIINNALSYITASPSLTATRFYVSTPLGQLSSMIFPTGCVIIQFKDQKSQIPELSCIIESKRSATEHLSVKNLQPKTTEGAEMMMRKYVSLAQKSNNASFLSRFPYHFASSNAPKRD